MSTTQMLTTDLNTKKLWSMEVWEQAIQNTVFGHAFNRGSVYFAKDLMGQRAKGDEITFSYVGKLTGLPVGEGGTAVNNAEALDLTSHKMAMNVSRIPVASPNDDTIEQQRTEIDFNDQMRSRIADRVAELMDASFFQQAAGADPTTLTVDGTTYSTAAQKAHVLGHNAVVAPTTDRIIRPNAVATDQALTSSDTFNLQLLDYFLEKNQRTLQPIAALAGMEYDLYLAPEQLTDLMHDASASIQWYNIELARIQAGSKNAIDNPYKNNIMCAGKYKNINIFSASRVANGVSTADSSLVSNVRRAVIMGKDALSFASPFGGRPTDKDVPFKFKEELVDIGYTRITEGRMIYGLKKMTPTGKQDNGVSVISTYAAAHA